MKMTARETIFPSLTLLTRTQRWHNWDTDMQGPMKLSPIGPNTLFLPKLGLDQNPKDQQM